MTDTDDDRIGTVLDDRIETVLDDVFPKREIAEIHEAGPSWNDKNETVAVEFAETGNIFLKIAADGDGSRIAREAAVIEYVDSHCEVSVPTVLASGADREVPFLATAPMDEQNLLALWSDWSVDQRATAVRQFGATLAAIHDNEFDQHGRIVGGDAEKLALESRTWPELLAEHVDRRRELASTDRFAHHFEAVHEAIESNRDRLADVPATLVYGDPAQPNLFWGESGIGLIDWEIAHVGDPARELHRASNQLIPDESDHEERLVSALEDGYRGQAGSLPDGFEERAPIYDAVWFLSKSGFFDKWVEFADEDPEEATDWVETEMNRRLDRL